MTRDRFTFHRDEAIITPAESDEDRARAFLEEFGLTLDGGFVQDRSGHPLALSRRWTEGLDRYSADELARAGRAIAMPDEIRQLWKRGADDSRLLTRRYIARIDGVDVACDLNRAGWCFATSEDSGFDLDQVRHGELVWSRGSGPADHFLS